MITFSYAELSTPIDVAFAGGSDNKLLVVVDRTTKPHTLNLQKDDGTSHTGFINEFSSTNQTGSFGELSFSYNPVEATITTVVDDPWVGVREKSMSGGKT